MNKIIKELQEALNTDNKTKAYDTQAKVVRSEGSTLWVHIPGGVDETPVKKTIGAKVGDTVQVRVAGGSAWIVGNQSAPPTDDARANYIGELAAPSIEYVKELTDKDVTVKSITAATGYIGELTADHITAQDISASSGYIKELQADNITAEDISADHATIGNLDANYAQIDAANITELSAQNAWVNKIMVQTGLIAHQGTVFTLDAIQVNAANITAGTLDVNRLIVTVDGQKYLVNVNPSTGTPTYEKLDGNIVEPRTITADKIVAHDITVQEITTENLVGTNGWINLNQGKFRYTTNGTTLANSTNGIEWDGTNLKIKGNVEITSSNTIPTKQELQDAVNNIEGLNVRMTVNGANLVFTVTLIQGGADITSTIPDGDFEWFSRTPTGDVPLNLNGKSITIPQASQEYGRAILCVWTRNHYAYLLNNVGNNLITNSGNKLVGRSEY